MQEDLTIGDRDDICRDISGNISRLRLYGQVENAFTLTKYTGCDPEVSGGFREVGVDRGVYPQNRTVTFGVNVTF